MKKNVEIIKRLKKSWFSLICYITAILLLIFSIVGAWFLDDETWWMATQLISTLSSVLLLIIIGVANQPREEK